MQFQGFRPLRMANGSTNLPSIEAGVINNSDSVIEGGMCMYEAFVAPTAAITDSYDGIALGFVVNAGKLNIPLASVSGNSTYVDGTYTSAVTGSTYAAASDNQTVKKVAALLMFTDGLIMSGYLSAAAGTTNAGSGDPGYRMDVVAGTHTNIDEATVASTSSATTTNDFMTLPGVAGDSALDPADTGGRRVICKVVVSDVLA